MLTLDECCTGLECIESKWEMEGLKNGTERKRQLESGNEYVRVCIISGTSLGVNWG